MSLSFSLFLSHTPFLSLSLSPFLPPLSLSLSLTTTHTSSFINKMTFQNICWKEYFILLCLKKEMKKGDSCIFLHKDVIYTIILCIYREVDPHASAKKIAGLEKNIKKWFMGSFYTHPGSQKVQCWRAGSGSARKTVRISNTAKNHSPPNLLVGPFWENLQNLFSSFLAKNITISLSLSFLPFYLSISIFLNLSIYP